MQLLVKDGGAPPFVADLPPTKVVDEMKKLTLAGQYLSVELPDGSYLVKAIDKGERIGMQFAREVRSS